LIMIGVTDRVHLKEYFNASSNYMDLYPMM
jgi:hypothetical protein